MAGVRLSFLLSESERTAVAQVAWLKGEASRWPNDECLAMIWSRKNEEKSETTFLLFLTRA